MPELPEIEHLKRTLAPIMIGAVVRTVDLQRRDIVHRPVAASSTYSLSADLLAGCYVSELVRHGKNLAIVSECGRSLCVHLGMSGQMVYLPAGRRLAEANHVHCVWHLQTNHGPGRLVFRDPRRFGGLWTFDSIESLRRARFDPLGPDALTISARHLRQALQHSRRPIKAALLDQSVLAGVGNIYADESLFSAKIHPASIACAIPSDRVSCLAQSIRAVLRAAIRAGGSTIESYIDANGEQGLFALSHKVYGRAKEPCAGCGKILVQTTMTQRTTVHCDRCQRYFR